MAVLNMRRIAGAWLHTGVTWRALQIVIPRAHPRPMTLESLQVKSGANSFKTPQVIPIFSQSSKLLPKRKARQPLRCCL